MYLQDQIPHKKHDTCLNDQNTRTSLELKHQSGPLARRFYRLKKKTQETRKKYAWQIYQISHESHAIDVSRLVSPSALADPFRILQPSPSKQITAYKMLTSTFGFNGFVTFT